MATDVEQTRNRRAILLLLRAIAAFLALPALVAFGIPIWIGTSSGGPARYVTPAMALVCVGALLLLWCAREFYVSGRGTLAPWDPPKYLVTSGPYRISRNPMYIGVVIILAGWSTLWVSRTLMVYAALFAIGFHIRVLLFEEPSAARRFGSQWDAYRAAVPRWVI